MTPTDAAATTPPRRRRVQAGRAYLVGLVILFAIATAPLGAGDEKFHLLAAVTAIAVILSWRLAPPPAALARPLAGLAVWAVATCMWAPDRHAAFAALVWLAALAAVAGAGCALGRRGLDGAGTAYLVVAVPTLAYGLLQYFGILPHDHWANEIRLAGPFLNSNLYAGFAAVALLVAAARVADGEASLGARLASTVPFALALTSLPLTVSRGGWLATGAGVVVLMARPRGRARKSPRRMASAAALAATLGAIAVAVIFVARGGGAQAIRERLTGAGTYSVSHRLAIYVGSLHLLRAEPLGVGLAGYRAVFPRFRQHSDRFEVNFAHSDPLELACTLGIPGLAAAIVVLWRLGRSTLAARPIPLSAWGAVAAATAVVVQSCFDFTLRKPVLVLFVAAAAGALAGHTGAVRLAGRGPIRIAAAALLAMSAVLGYGHHLLTEADHLEAKGALFAAARAYERANRFLWPGAAAAARAAGAVNGRLARTPLIGETFLPRADSWYSIARRRARFDAQSHLAGGIIASALLRQPEAQQLVERAAELNPTGGATLIAAADVLDRQGDIAAALRLRAAALGTSPRRSRPAVVADESAPLPAELVALAVARPSAGQRELLMLLRNDGRAETANLIAARLGERWPGGS